jgi:DNA-binding transcriptional LysR family regulator
MSQLEEMQTFIRIVEAGSITKAAEQMNTAKSAVSRRLSELETRLGISLLTRTTRSQTLTNSGEYYYRQCIRVIDDINEVESSIGSEHKALTGRIKIAAPLSFGIAKLCPVLKQFHDIYPDIIFDIDFNDRRVDLIDEGFDLAIRIAHLTDSSLIARRLTTVKLIHCASPEYLQQYGLPLTPDDLMNGHIKLHYHTAQDNWHFKDELGKPYSIKLPKSLTTNNGDFACQAAMSGWGIAYLPDFICSPALEAGTLTPILSNYMDNNELGVYAVYPQTRHLSQRVSRLINFLSEHFKNTD